MRFNKAVLILLILSLLTGGITFSGFLAGTAFLGLFQILFPILVILFIVALIRSLLYKGPRP